MAMWCSDVNDWTGDIIWARAARNRDNIDQMHTVYD